MGHKEKASAKIREINFNDLSSVLDKAVKEHYYVAAVTGHYYHDIEYWDRVIAARTADIPQDERIPPERLKQLLEGKVGPLLNNNCISCGRLVKHLAEKYHL